MDADVLVSADAGTYLRAVLQVGEGGMWMGDGGLGQIAETCCIEGGGEKFDRSRSALSRHCHRELGVPEMNSNLRGVCVGVDWKSGC